MWPCLNGIRWISFLALRSTLCSFESLLLAWDVYLWEDWIWGERRGSAGPLSFQPWSCSSLHSYLYIVRAGSGPGNGSCATGPSAPGSRLSYFFNCCIFPVAWQIMGDNGMWGCFLREIYSLVHFLPSSRVPFMFSFGSRPLQIVS